MNILDDRRPARIPRSGVAMAGPDAAKAPAAVRPLRILVVDDDPMIQLVLGGYLKKWGHEVTLAAAATEALELLEAGPFDLIMSDLVMPGIDGLMFAEHAKRRWPRIPFILVTGFAKRLSTNLPHAVDLLMIKPVSFEEIGVGLESLLGDSSHGGTAKIS